MSSSSEAPSAPGSGAKAKKGKKLHITEFLKPEKSGRWADDDLDDSNLDGLAPLPTAPGEGPSYSAGGVSRPAAASRPLPAQPPWKCYISNVPFQADAEQIGTIFYPELKVVDVLMLHHHDTGNAKGCFVEFDTREDLEKALQKNGTVVSGRPINVDVAEERPSHSRGDARRDDFGGGRERRRGYGFGESGYDDERGGGGGFGRDRSRGGGGFADSYGRERSSGGSFADSYGRDRERGGRDAPEAGGRGYGFSRGGGYEEDRRGFEPRPDERGRERGGFSGRHEDDHGGDRWARSREPPAARGRDSSREPAPNGERPRIALQPRTRPLGVELDAPVPTARKSNPFGDAKPNDAAARIREIDEREAKRKAEVAAKHAAELAEAKAAEARRPHGARPDSQPPTPTAGARAPNGDAASEEGSAAGSTPTAAGHERRGGGRAGGRGGRGEFAGRGPYGGRGDHHGGGRGDHGGGGRGAPGGGARGRGGRGEGGRGEGGRGEGGPPGLGGGGGSGGRHGRLEHEGSGEGAGRGGGAPARSPRTGGGGAAAADADSFQAVGGGGRGGARGGGRGGLRIHQRAPDDARRGGGGHGHEDAGTPPPPPTPPSATAAAPAGKDDAQRAEVSNMFSVLNVDDE